MLFLSKNPSEKRHCAKSDVVRDGRDLLRPVNMLRVACARTVTGVWDSVERHTHRQHLYVVLLSASQTSTATGEAKCCDAFEPAGVKDAPQLG